MAIMVPSAVSGQDGIIDGPLRWTVPEPVGKVVAGSTWFVVVDGKGNPHVLYTGIADDESPTDYSVASPAIYYRYKAGGQWTPSIDIAYFLDLEGSNAFPSIVDAQYDTARDLITVLVSASGNLYVLQGASGELNAHSWVKKAVFSGFASFYPCFALDHSGAVQLFVGAENSILHLSSLDGVQQWSTEQSVVSLGPNEEMATCRAIADPGLDVVHLTWSESDGAFGWNPISIWYARVATTNSAVSDLVNIWSGGPDTASWSNLSIAPDGGLWLSWERGVGSPDGRHVRTSMDDGRTWSESNIYWPEMSGLTGFNYVFWDRQMNPHVLSMGAVGTTGEELSVRSGRLDRPVAMATKLGESEHVRVAIFRDISTHLLLAEQGLLQYICGSLSKDSPDIACNQNESIAAEEAVMYTPAPATAVPVLVDSIDITHESHSTNSSPPPPFYNQPRPVDDSILKVAVSLWASFVLVAGVVGWRAWARGRQG